MRKLLLFILLLPTIAFAQGTATNIRNGSTLPTACANGDIFYKTTSPIGVHECSVPGNPGTWRRLYPTSASVIALFSGTCDNTTWLRGDGACAAPAGAATPGSDKQIIFNDSGSPGADSKLTFDKTTGDFNLGDGSTRATLDLLGAAGAPSNPTGSRCRIYFNTTSGLIEFVNSSGSSCGPSGNAGTVTHTGGALTSGSLVAGAGSADIAVLGSDPTNCSAGQAPTGIDKTGAAKGCFTPSGGSSGALILLEQHTASSSATLAFTTAISATYDEYVIEFVNLVPASTNVSFQMRMSTNGGSTYDSGTNYTYLMVYNGIGDSTTQAGANTQAQIDLAHSVSTQANWSTNGHIRLFNPGGSLYKMTTGEVVSPVGSGSLYRWTTSGTYLSTTAVNAFDFFYSSGNIASGTIRVYGVAK